MENVTFWQMVVAGTIGALFGMWFFRRSKKTQETELRERKPKDQSEHEESDRF